MAEGPVLRLYVYTFVHVSSATKFHMPREISGTNEFYPCPSMQLSYCISEGMQHCLKMLDECMLAY